jgi:hypothetical protein
MIWLIFRFEKTENLSVEGYKKYTHLLTSNPKLHRNDFDFVGNWLGFDSVRCEIKNWLVKRTLSLPCQILYKPQVYLLQRKQL